ncbi:MAG: alpha/beta hydrolase [Butyrivibrio sp.]|nr:alpha/beta hydrolase [Butyrivibrio sp.]
MQNYMYIIIPLILITIICVLIPPSTGQLPKGHAISEKTKLDINGTNIGTIILSDNVDNPVLLVCGGGPGIPQYLVESLYPSVLPEFFTVCYFDYRGTGLSFESDANPDDMTTERFIDDAILVTDYLRDRFGQEKIYIMGHSFGTYIALNVVSLHPEKYIAYMAMSQCCDQYRSELLAYDYMRSQYEAQGKNSMVKKFDKYRIHESQEDYEKYSGSGLRDKAMHELGVGTTSNMDNVITGLFFPSLRVTAYTPFERINLWRGKAYSGKFAVHNESRMFNAFESVRSIDIPIWFFAGEHDMTCATSVQKEYYETIQAPEKEFFMYKGCAHSPIYEDGVRTREILKKML